MLDFLLILLLVMLATPAVVLASRRFPPELERMVWYGFLAHVVFLGAMFVLLVLFYGGGDMMVYRREALPLAEALRFDFGPAAREMLAAINGERVPNVWMSGSTTGTMVALAGFLLYVTMDSLYGACTLIGFWTFSGQLALLFVACREMPRHLHRRFAIAVLFVPSVLFWSSALLKDGPVMGALGWLVLGTHWLIAGRRRLTSVTLVVAMGYFIAILKPYVLFPYVIAAPIWFAWHRWSETWRAATLLTRPLYLALAATIAIVGVTSLGLLFPRFAADNLAQEAAKIQGFYHGQGGGSTYRVGNPSETSFAGQAALAPLGLVSSLFRPFLFEVHNVAAAINGLEMTAILWLWFQIFRRRRVTEVLRAVLQSPFLVFCAIYVLPLAVGVGVASPNLGSLSRYRIPMMPFYIGLLLALAPWTKWDRRPRRSPENGSVR